MESISPAVGSHTVFQVEVKEEQVEKSTVKKPVLTTILNDIDEDLSGYPGDEDEQAGD